MREKIYAAVKTYINKPFETKILTYQGFEVVVPARMRPQPKTVKVTDYSGTECKMSEPDVALMSAFGYDDKKVRDYIKKMMGRLTFLHFLQRKGWLCGDLNYLQNLFVRSQYQDDYLDSVLEPLFFGILNTKPEGRKRTDEQNVLNRKNLMRWQKVVN